MQIIPVIDLKNGIVVHARQGNRDQYAPVKSKICTSADIFEVIDVFSCLFHFQTIYIADLNAITQQSHNAELISDVLKKYPDITFWIDGGYPLCNNIFQQFNNFLPVLGSESFQEENLCDINKFNNHFILSLDYSMTGELGAKTLFSNQDFWPEQIIIMCLSKVGSNSGPDMDKLVNYRKNFPQQKIVASGGIRNCEDLIKLEQLGVRQALVATALHNGMIDLDDITNLQAKKYPD